SGFFPSRSLGPLPLFRLVPESYRVDAQRLPQGPEQPHLAFYPGPSEQDALGGIRGLIGDLQPFIHGRFYDEIRSWVPALAVLHLSILDNQVVGMLLFFSLQVELVHDVLVDEIFRSIDHGPRQIEKPIQVLLFGHRLKHFLLSFGLVPPVTGRRTNMFTERTVYILNYNQSSPIRFLRGREGS